MNTDEDLRDARRLEHLGDAAASIGEATAYYRQAQLRLLPVGTVWNDRHVYKDRMAGFERIQQKLYTLTERAPAPQLAPEGTGLAVPPSEAGAVPFVRAELSVWDFSPGLIVRVARAFTDYDGQQICAGEVLHFVDSSYFFYDGGYTLRFAEKTIRLAGTVEEHQAIIDNAGNTWFQPLESVP